jgi:hypothetical protein
VDACTCQTYWCTCENKCYYNYKVQIFVFVASYTWACNIETINEMFVVKIVSRLSFVNMGKTFCSRWEESSLDIPEHI